MNPLLHRYAKAPAVVPFAVFLAVLAVLPAFPADPYAACVYPAGGRVGTRFQAAVSGQNLGNPQGILVSGDGVSAKVLGYVGQGGPLTRVQEEELKRVLKELAAGGPRTAPPPGASLPDIEELRNLESKTKAQLRLVYDQFLNRDKRPKSPMDETVLLEFTVEAGAEAGDRELRVRTKAGLTNPLVFQVGTQAETLEPGRFQEPPSLPPPVRSDSVVNGRIFPGEADRFRLALRKGETVELAAAARRLIPYIADAVPGWFQAVLSVRGPDGKELAYCDDSGLDPDPRLVFAAPGSGDYTLVLRDALYRGREDFVYRLFIRPIPAASSSGAASAAPVIPGSASPAPAAPAPSAGAPGNVLSASFPGAFSGVLARPGEVHAYEFRVSAGGPLVAEVRARRDGSPLDALLHLRDSGGKVLAVADDAEDKDSGLLTYHADALLRAELPGGGVYRLEIQDTLGRGGADFSYRLDLRKPRPDFAVYTTASALNLGATGTADFTVTALRRDGWQGEIRIRLASPSEGLTLEGGLVPADRDSARMTITGRLPRGSEESVRIALEAAGRVEGAELVRAVKPADLRMQAFGNTHLVQTEALWVGAARNRDPGFVRTPAGPIRIAPGGSAEFVFAYPPLPVKELQAFLLNPPAGISLAGQRAEAGRLILTLAASADAKPGIENIVVALRGVPEPKDPGAKAAASKVSAPKPVDLGPLPAIPVEVR